VAMKRNRKDRQVATKDLSEKQLHAVAKTALKKADRHWRLVEKGPSEHYREHHMTAAREQSAAAAEATRQAIEIRAKARAKTE
jgi:hypothetical protein